MARFPAGRRQFRCPLRKNPCGSLYMSGCNKGSYVHQLNYIDKRHSEKCIPARKLMTHAHFSKLISM